MKLLQCFDHITIDNRSTLELIRSHFSFSPQFYHLNFERFETLGCVVEGNRGSLHLFLLTINLKKNVQYFIPKIDHSRTLFPLFLCFVGNFIFYKQISFYEGGIRAADQWCRRRPLYQMCHNLFHVTPKVECDWIYTKKLS